MYPNALVPKGQEDSLSSDILNNFDFNQTWVTPVDDLGDVGVEIEADYDLSFGYTFPWFNEEQFMIFAVQPNFKLGGIVHIVFHLYYLRIHVWVSVIGNELTLIDWRTKMDVVEYSQVCTSAEARQETGKIRTNIQFDFNECMFGILGFAIDDTIDCAWKEYYLSTPIFDEGLYNLDKLWVFQEEKCWTAEDVTIFQFDPELNSNQTPQ